MSIDYTDDLAVFSDCISVEDAEGLLSWLQNHPRGRLDLTACTHLHTANLQILMAARPDIVAWPQDTDLATWLKNILYQGS